MIIIDNIYYSKVTKEEIYAAILMNGFNDWEKLLHEYQLSEDVLEEFAEQFTWDGITAYQQLSDKFIEEHKDKLDWTILSIKNREECFIRTYQDRVNWKIIKQFQNNFSDQFKEQFKKELDI